MSFIKKFWEGNGSMVISFWIFNVLIEQIIIVLLAVIVVFSNLSQLLIIFMWAQYKIWAVVGFWRSAAKYKEKPIWPGLAKTYIVVSLILLVARTIWRNV